MTSGRILEKSDEEIWEKKFKMSVLGPEMTHLPRFERNKNFPQKFETII